MESDQISSAKEIIIGLTDGTELQFKNVSIQEDGIIGYAKEAGSDKFVKKEIDFSSIKYVKTEKLKTNYLLLYGAVAVVAALLFYGMATAPSPPPSGCCPFIYSFDGENYIFDAEPYGGAICRGLMRSEWCTLEHVKEINDQYNIVIANELDETQYTDELKVIVVDHPPGTKVAPDASGKIHSISNPITAMRMVDHAGNNLMPIFSRKDGQFWQTSMAGKNPNSKEDLKDELIFEFPKPKDAKKAKLLVNGCTSLWGSQIAKEFLELYGNTLPEWYNEVDNYGPAFQRLMNWYYDEELYLLQIRVDTEKGWKSKGVIFGGGPFISEDKVYTIDISDISSDTLKIKLTPAATFWMIDHICVDYTDNIDLTVTEIETIEGFDDTGQDVRQLLARADNNFLIMPEKGDRAELVFPAPPSIDGMNRTIILKSTGYYQIHIQGQGEAQYEILDKIHSQPGFSIRYALQKYIESKGKSLGAK
jgi:hypothetical protein